MPNIFNSLRAHLREGYSSFIMLLLLLAWGSVLLARFLQGVSIQPPEKKALLSLLNTGMPENTLRPWSETTAETLAIWDAINQGLIFVLSELIGMLVGSFTVALVNSFRLESIRELCSKGIPPEFYDRVGRLKAKCTLPWSSSEEAPRDLQANLLQEVNVDHA